MTRGGRASSKTKGWIRRNGPTSGAHRRGEGHDRSFRTKKERGEALGAKGEGRKWKVVKPLEQSEGEALIRSERPLTAEEGEKETQEGAYGKRAGGAHLEGGGRSPAIASSEEKTPCPGRGRGTRAVLAGRAFLRHKGEST